MVWYAGLNTAPPAPPAATEATQLQVRDSIALIKIDMAAIRARQYDKADHKELQPGDSLTLPAGSYHKVSWSVQPVDPNNPDFSHHAKVNVNNGARYFINEAGTYTATELSAIDFTVDANQARVIVIWEF